MRTEVEKCDQLHGPGSVQFYTPPHNVRPWSRSYGYETYAIKMRFPSAAITAHTTHEYIIIQPPNRGLGHCSKPIFRLRKKVSWNKQLEWVDQDNGRSTSRGWDGTFFSNLICTITAVWGWTGPCPSTERLDCRPGKKKPHQQGRVSSAGTVICVMKWGPFMPGLFWSSGHVRKAGDLT